MSSNKTMLKKLYCAGNNKYIKLHNISEIQYQSYVISD